MSEERFGRYEIETVLGRGGMGTVYACRDTETGDRLALKVLSADILDDEEKFLRFEQEVTALGRLRHENIVRLLGPLERDGDKVFFPMEIIEGETLSVKLRREGPQPVAVAMTVAKSLLLALDAAHRAGVVHRDVKPSNIIVSGDSLKVMDFGLARMEDITRLTRTGQLMGTLEYMSPEQCEGEGIDPRTDLYSTGIILYELLAGKPPFSRQSPGTILKGHLTEVPRPIAEIRADLPDGLGDAITRMLEKKPENRFATAREALDALEAVPDPATTVTFHLPGVAPPDSSGASSNTAPASSARRWLIPVLLVGGLLAAIVMAGLIWPPFPAEPVQATRTSPEETLESVHEAIRARDFAVFSECFDESVLARITEAEFRARALAVADLGYRMEIPLRGAAGRGVFYRVGSSPALATILGKSPGATLRVGMEHDDGGFRIVRVSSEVDPTRRPPGNVGGPGPGGGSGEIQEHVLRARVTELFDNLDKYAPVILTRLEKDGRITKEQSAQVTESLKTLSAEGAFKYRIIEEESTFQGGRAEVVVACPKLAKLLGLEDERFAVDLSRRAGGRGTRGPRIRPVSR